MKKTSIIINIILLIFIMGFSSLAEENAASLKVKINNTGSVLISPEINENLNAKYIEVRVYKHGEIITQNVDELPTPLVWKMAADGPFYYSGSPGKYFAVLLEVAQKCTVLADPVEFEIPAIPIPTQSPATPAPTPEGTPLPTVPATKTPPASSQTATVKPTQALQTATAASDSDDHSENSAIIWVCAGSAAVILIGVVIFTIAHRKKKS